MPSGYVDGTLSNYGFDATKQILKENLNYIEGMPYQFLDSVDPRIELSSGSKTLYGRKYAEKILSRMPLLYLTPCEPLFLGGNASNAAERTFLGALMTGNEGTGLLSLLDDSDVKSQRYYTAQFASADYYKYLNFLLNQLANYMGLYEEKVIVGGKEKILGEVDWSEETNGSQFESLFYEATTGNNSLYFYCDAMDSISESFTNDTTQSSLANQINGFSDQVKEIQFLLGGDSAGGLAGSALSTLQETLQGEGALGWVESLGSALGDILTGDSLVKKIMDGSSLGAITSGGKIIFPEIWSDSQYSKSYSIDIKLRSPDHDSLSIYLNILKPYCKLLCLTLPRIFKDASGKLDPNGYGSPFLVKAACKGKFSMDLGIITGLSATKGAACAWNDDGLPTQIDVSLDIKDLYSSLSMSGYPNLGVNIFSDFKQLMNNTSNAAYMDFIANMAGLNVNEMLPFSKLKSKYYSLRSVVNEIPSTVSARFSQAIANAISKISWIK